MILKLHFTGMKLCFYRVECESTGNVYVNTQGRNAGTFPPALSVTAETRYPHTEKPKPPFKDSLK